MAIVKKPTPVTGTIIIGVVSCSVAALTVMVHGDRGMATAAASFGVAMLVRGLYGILRGFDLWREVQWEQGQRQLDTGLAPGPELVELPTQQGVPGPTSESQIAASASWPLLSATPARYPDPEH